MKQQSDISLAQWSLIDEYRAEKWKPLDFPRLAREDFNLNGVEFVNTLFEVPTHTYLKQLKQNLESYNITPVLIMVDEEGDGCSATKEGRSEFVTFHRKWVDIAQYLGCHAIRTNCRGPHFRPSPLQSVHPDIPRYNPPHSSPPTNTSHHTSSLPNQLPATPPQSTSPAAPSHPTSPTSPPIDPMDALDWASESYAKLLSYAKPAGIKILIENHGGVSNDPDWMVSLMRAVDDPFFGAYPDWREPAPDFDNVNYLKKTLPFAKGMSYRNQPTADLTRKMLECCRQAGFHGWYGIESDGREAIKKGIRILKDFLTQDQEI